jgi:hypothetical protein
MKKEPYGFTSVHGKHLNAQTRHCGCDLQAITTRTFSLRFRQGVDRDAYELEKKQAVTGCNCMTRAHGLYPCRSAA